MSWSWKITLLYLGFVTLILTLVFRSCGNKSELEYSDYYSRELKFQEQITAGRNAANLESPIAHAVNGQELRITVPQSLRTGDLKGRVELVRPSDASLDQVETFSPDADGTHSTAVPKKGKYKLRVSLTSGGTGYYYEADLKFK